MGVFAMPSLGADMDEGTLAEWLVKPGDAVKRGDVVAVVETQKGAIEIECFDEGTVEALVAAEGERLPVGAPLARIRAPGEAPAEAAEPVAAKATAAPPPATEAAPPAARPAPQPAAARPPATPAAPRHRAGPVPASPAARARAAEAGLDLAALPGSGPGGAVLLADVEAALAAAPAAEAPAPVPRPSVKSGLDPTAMRERIAAMMARSKREIPHYYLAHTVDLQPAADWLAARNADRPPEARVLMGALIAHATAQAARGIPEVNGTFEDGAFRPSETVNLGVIVALRGGGLIAPAILGAEALDLDGIMDAMRDLVARTRTGRLKNSELTQGTLTLTSMGEGGTEAVTGVIYPPQVAIVGAGAPVVRPWVVDGAVVPRLTLTLTLAADHRVSDGRRGAKFLAEIARRLQEPTA